MMDLRNGLSRLFPAALCLALLPLSSLPAAAQVENGAIAGQITVARGSFPPDRIEVTLQTRGIIVNQAWTDDEGKFLFRDLPENLYHVIINDEKYEPYQEDVKLNPHTNPTNILTIRLTPKAAAKPDAAPSAVGGGNPYMVDPAEYEKRFPRKVVKELENGVKYQANGQTADAVRHFQAALKLAPDFYPAHNNLGTIYLSQSKFAAAQGEFEAVLRLKQSDTQAYFNLGNVFLLTGHYDDCLHMVEEGLRRQPNSGFGQFLLGSVYGRMGKLPEAERALHEAILFDSSLSRAYLELVNLYMREKRTTEAIGELKLFLRSFPADPLVPKAQQVLGHLEGSGERVSKVP
jgi:tetratricopeptide (TPR) repeat protein